MDRGGNGRLSLVVLAVGATVALAVGGAWWTAAAPETAPAVVPITGAPSLPAGDPVLVDPESLLPFFPDTVVRQVERLGPDESFAVGFEAARDARYLLQYVCLGPERLRIRTEGAINGPGLYELDCAGSFDTIELVAAGPYLRIGVERAGAEPAEVGVQVIALP